MIPSQVKYRHSISSNFIVKIRQIPDSLFFISRIVNTISIEKYKIVFYISYSGIQRIHSLCMFVYIIEYQSCKILLIFSGERKREKASTGCFTKHLTISFIRQYLSGTYPIIIGLTRFQRTQTDLMDIIIGYDLPIHQGMRSF